MSVMMCYGYAYTRSGKNRAVATSIAKRYIEEYKGNIEAIRNIMNLDSGYLETYGLPERIEEFQDPDVKDIVVYKVYITISNANHVSNRVYNISSQVKWLEKGGEKRVVLETLVLNE